MVITCLGDPRRTVEAVHGYGGIVFCDVVNALHARKAIEGGADGLICVGGGAGGHASNQSAFSLVREVREFWDGCLVLGGSISDGHQIRAAEVLGADLAYMGTRFIATRESQAQDAYKQMIVDCSVKDIIYSDRFSGVFANFLLPSITRYGIDPETLPKKAPDMSGLVGCRGEDLERHLERGARHRHHSRRAERRRTCRPARARISGCVRGAGQPSTGGILMRHTFVIEDKEHEAWLSRRGEGYALHFGEHTVPVALTPRGRGAGSARRRGNLRASSSRPMAISFTSTSTARPSRFAMSIRCSATAAMRAAARTMLPKRRCPVW